MNRAKELCDKLIVAIPDFDALHISAHKTDCSEERYVAIMRDYKADYEMFCVVDYNPKTKAIILRRIIGSRYTDEATKEIILLAFELLHDYGDVQEYGIRIVKHNIHIYADNKIVETIPRYYVERATIGYETLCLEDFEEEQEDET